jgi:uncharacterized protein YuzE
MGDAYPELRQARDRVADTLRTEEEQFAKTLENGMKLFEAGAKTEARVTSYIRDHFVRDLVSYDEGVFHKAGEDVLVKVVKAGSVMNVDELVRSSIAEVERYSAKSGKPARMYLVFHGSSDKTPKSCSTR